METNPKLFIEDLPLPPVFPETTGRIGNALPYDADKAHYWDSTDKDSTFKLVSVIGGLVCKQPMETQLGAFATWDGSHLLILGDGLPFPGLWAKGGRHREEGTIGGWTQNLDYDAPEAPAALAAKAAQILLDGNGMLIFAPNGNLASYLLLALTLLANDHSQGSEGARAIWEKRPRPKSADLSFLSPAQEKALWCLKAGSLQNAKGTVVPSAPRGVVYTYSRFVSDDFRNEPEEKAESRGVDRIRFDEHVLEAKMHLMRCIQGGRQDEWGLEMAIECLIGATLKATLIHGQEAMEVQSPWDLD